LRDAECESDSSDDQSPSDEYVLEIIVSKPLSEEEIIPMESLRTHDSSLPISSKIDSLLDEFAGKLTLLKSIPPGIDEADCDFEEDIRLIEKLLYDNSSPRPPEEFVSLNSTLAKITEQMTSITSLCEMACTFVQKKLEEKQLEEERAAKAQNWKLPVCYDDDDDEERSDSLDEHIISGLPPFYAITPDEPVLSTEEPDNSLSMREEHLDTIPATKSDEFIKSSVENLIPILSESEGIPDHMCDVPSIDNSPPLDISKDQIEDLSDLEVMEIVIPKVGGIEASNDNPIPFYDPIIFGTPLNLTPSGESDFLLEVDAFLAVEDEFTSSQFPTSYLDPKGDMILFKVFLDDDHSSDFKTKSASTSLNSLLEETNNFNNSLPEFTTFSNVLCDAEYESNSSNNQSCSDKDVLETIVSKPLCEEEINPMKSLRTHDSSLLISSNINSLLDEFAGELTLLKSISTGIDETDCDFEKDIRLIEKLLYDNSSPRPPEEFVSLNSDAASESFSPSHILVKDSDSFMEEIDLFCTPDYPMPPGIEDKDYDSERDILIPKDMPSDNSLSFAKKESFHFDISLFSRPPAKPPDGDTRILNIKMMGDIYDQKAFMHKLMITLAPHQEKSPDLLSHRCGTVKKFDTHHIRLIEILLYDNSSPRPPKEFVFENSDAEIKSFSPSPILVKDSDSFMEEIDLSFTPDNPMPPGIEEDDYDSERDILIREELLDNYSL
nr:hypothetical protein [Tanacetum cinerariifolium]